jgi:dienelactone hydrolase
MDTCGCVPKGKYGNWARHEDGGPPGWGGFDRIDDPVRDQWTHHAVADVLLAHSLIRSFPEVDPDRTGLTGISWGGYLTCIAAGVDPRFKLAVPVYGCGFLGENSCWLPRFQKMGKDKADRWLALWDPSRHLPRAAMPMLWVTGTNDFAYPMDSLQKSYRLPKGTRTLCVRVRMPHGHNGPGENPEEIHAFADSLLRKGTPLSRITGQGLKEGAAWATFTDGTRVVKAELTFTRDAGNWKKRKWETAPATVDGRARRVSAPLPDDVTVYYLNLTDDKGRVVSTEHETR